MTSSPNPRGSFGSLMHDPDDRGHRRRRAGFSLSASSERVRPRGRVLVLGLFLALLALVSGAFDPRGIAPTGERTSLAASSSTPASEIEESTALLYKGITPYLEAADAAGATGADGSGITRLRDLYPSFADVIEAWSLTATQWVLPEQRQGSVPSRGQVDDFVGALRAFASVQDDYIADLTACADPSTGACSTPAFDDAYARLQQANAALLGTSSPPAIAAP